MTGLGYDAAGAVSAILVVSLALVFWGYCVRDFARTDERDLPLFSRQVWMLVLVVGTVAGAMLWYVARHRD